MSRYKILISLFLIFGLLTACSSTGYKTQKYAKLSSSKDFEEEFPVVWKATLAAIGDYKIEDKDQEKGFIKTDWIYSTSNEKYVEYQVNGFPRKKYLQIRYKFAIQLDQQMGGVKVTVNPEEEIERLKSDGSFDSWKSSSEPDSSRAHEMVKAIELKILSAHP